MAVIIAFLLLMAVAAFNVSSSVGAIVGLRALICQMTASKTKDYSSDLLGTENDH